jgi:hypothetical protein
MIPLSRTIDTLRSHPRLQQHQTSPRCIVMPPPTTTTFYTRSLSSSPPANHNNHETLTRGGRAPPSSVITADSQCGGAPLLRRTTHPAASLHHRVTRRHRTHKSNSKKLAIRPRGHALTVVHDGSLPRLFVSTLKMENFLFGGDKNTTLVLPTVIHYAHASMSQPWITKPVDFHENQENQSSLVSLVF